MEMDLQEAIRIVRAGFLHARCPDCWCECDASRLIAERVAKPVGIDRESLGRHVREAWVRWAQTQPNPKPSWLVPYDELSEADKEADCQIGEHIYLLTKLHCDAAASMRMCTCLGTCRGKEGLAEGWQCALEAK